MFRLRNICLAAGAMLACQPAKASVQVVGSGLAHECFVAAKAAINPATGIAICDAAMHDDLLSSRDRAATFVNRGVLENMLGRNDAAMADYENGIKLSPDMGDAYVDRGTVLIGMKRYDDALADINKGIGLGVSYPHLCFFNRAVVEELMGRFKDAYFDYKHVLELEPNYAAASDQLKNFIVTTGPAPGSAGGT